MALKKDTLKNILKKPFEEKEDLEKLHIYFAIVNKGNGDAIIRLFENIGSSMSYVHTGEGTANTYMKSVLGIIDPNKDVVVSILPEHLLEETGKQLNAFFAASKKNMGIGFSIRLTSVMGVKVYKFLTQTM